MRYDLPFNLKKENESFVLILQDIVVKVITSKLGEKYYKKKGVVTKVEDRYQAVIKMVDTNDKIRVDQAHVETVIPAIGKLNIFMNSRTNSIRIGKKVLIVNGAYRGQEATLEDIHQDSFSVDVTLLTVRQKYFSLNEILSIVFKGSMTGTRLDNMAYEDVSKIAD